MVMHFVLVVHKFCIDVPLFFMFFSISGSNNEMQANPENGGENQKVSFVVMAVSVFMGFLYIKH